MLLMAIGEWRKHGVAPTALKILEEGINIKVSPRWSMRINFIVRIFLIKKLK
jgi:hypothetical protein